jgi:hypothetical protein
VQMFVICNHMVDDVPYIPKKCPRCYGAGYYFDIFFDSNGSAVLAQGTLKLQQELLKISIEEQGSNKFHPDWGNETKRMVVGLKNTSIARQKVEMATIKYIQHLAAIQEGNNLTYNNMNDDEIISGIDSIYVDAISQDTCGVNFQVRSKARETLSVNYAVK